NNCTLLLCASVSLWLILLLDPRSSAFICGFNLRTSGKAKHENRSLLLSRSVAAVSVGARLRSHGGDAAEDRPHGGVRLVLAGAQAGRVPARLDAALPGYGAQEGHGRHPRHADGRAAHLACRAASGRAG